MYGKCSKIVYIKFPYKMAYANSLDPDQTACEGAVWSGSTLFAIPPSILRKKKCIKSKLWAKKVWNKGLKILGH